MRQSKTKTYNPTGEQQQHSHFPTQIVPSIHPELHVHDFSSSIFSLRWFITLEASFVAHFLHGLSFSVALAVSWSDNRRRRLGGDSASSIERPRRCCFFALFQGFFFSFHSPPVSISPLQSGKLFLSAPAPTSVFFFIPGGIVCKVSWRAPGRVLY